MNLTALYSSLLSLLLIIGVSCSTEAAEPKCLEDLICDSAQVLTEEQFQDLSEYHKVLRERYDIDYRIVAIPNAGDISEQSSRTFKAAEIGSHSKTKKGMLLFIDPAQNEVRLEISAGLDAVYTDAFVAYLQQRQMIPFFKASRVADGIMATTEMIVTRAQEAEEGKEFIAPEQLPENLAIGAGAQTTASIGSGYVPPPPAVKENPQPSGLSPEQVVAAYHQSLAARNGSPDLDIYTQATKELRRNWVLTPAQMANELKAYKKCELDKTVYIGKNALAVVRYKVEQRKCSPYFLVVENGAWRLDFVTMMENIRFNVDNDWHLDMRKPFPYADAFLDWSFNKDGYPFPRPKLRWGLTVETDYKNNVTWIKKIYPETPAASMGLRENDVILSWDGIKNPDYKRVTRSMDTLPDGNNFQVLVWRDGQKLTLDLTAPPKLTQDGNTQTGNAQSDNIASGWFMAGWPLDGIIGFIALIIGLFCLLTYGLFNIGQSKDAVMRDGYYRMTPMRSAKILALGIIIIVSVMLYAALQSGHCFSMTTEENRNNQIIGYTMAVIFLGYGLFTINKLLFAKYSFNQQEVVFKAPFRKQRTVKWQSISEIGEKWQYRFIKSREGDLIYLPFNIHRHGASQLETLINLKLYNFENPVQPLFYNEMIKDIQGKTILGSFICVTDDLHEKFVHDFSGVFDRVDKEHIYITSESGKSLVFPRNLRSFFINEMKGDSQEDPEEPDFYASWYLPANSPALGDLKNIYC